MVPVSARHTETPRLPVRPSGGEFCCFDGQLPLVSGEVSRFPGEGRGAEGADAMVSWLSPEPGVLSRYGGVLNGFAGMHLLGVGFLLVKNAILSEIPLLREEPAQLC